MRDKTISVGGNLARDLIRDLMETSLKKPIQTGELRKKVIEPAWVCPPDFCYEIIDNGIFKMEYLQPVDVVTHRVIMQLHGGGYIGEIKNIYRKFAVQYSKRSMGSDVLTLDYRVAPEHPYPAALEDAVYAYEWLLNEKHYHHSQIVLAGDSAGGGLALSLVMYLRDHGMPLPGGILVMSPWTDLTCSGDSYKTKFEIDPLFGNSTESMLYHSSYIGDHDATEPYISPVFGNYSKFPPMLMQVGSYEMLLSDTLRTADLAREEKIKLRVSVYDGMFHVFQMGMNLFQESREAWEEVEEFLHIIYHLKRKPDGIIVRKVKNRKNYNENYISHSRKNKRKVL